jgi:hypothetical protein
MIRFAVAATALALLSACASTATWQHPERYGDGHDGATMALAECEAYAAGLRPAPTPPTMMPEPAPSSYTTRGTYTGNGSYGTFTGTTRANSGSSFASGYNSGAAMASAIMAAQHQNRVKELAAACMRKLGWVETSTPEGQAQFKKVSAERRAKLAAAKESEAENAARAKWEAAIDAFLDVEAAMPGGIDYRKDPVKLAALDKYVKELANDPKNGGRSMTWYLVEASKLVRAQGEK